MLKTLTLLLAGGAVVAYVASGKIEPEADIAYVTAPVEYGRLEETVTSTGTVGALLSVDVSSQVSGRITKVLADFNDRVTEGQPLARIDRQAFEARVAEARAAVAIALASVDMQKAALRRAEVQIEAAELELAVLKARIAQGEAGLKVALSSLTRKKELLKSGTVSSADIEDEQAKVDIARAWVWEIEALHAAAEKQVHGAEADLRQAMAELAAAEANVPQRQALLRLAEVELERTTIRSPIDGVIISRSIDAGQTVAAALEAPVLFTIAQALDRMVVHVSVDETDIGQVKEGQTASLRIEAFPGRIFRGEVSEIRKSARVLHNVVTYTVVISTENLGELLFPGMTALVTISIRASEPTLKVPTEALAFVPSSPSQADPQEGGPHLWLLSPDGAPSPVPIRTGDQDASHTGVKGEGLKEGQAVILGEYQKRKPGGFLRLQMSE